MDGHDRGERADARHSLKSWDRVERIFPEIDWERDKADTQVKQGRQSEDAQSTLAAFGGEKLFHSKKSQGEQVVGPDDEDENGHAAFKESTVEDPRGKERQEEKESDNSASESTLRCSQAPLVDVSSVELSVGCKELAKSASLVCFGRQLGRQEQASDRWQQSK